MLDDNCMKQVRTFLILEGSELADEEKVRIWENIEGANHVSLSHSRIPSSVNFLFLP